MEGGVLAAETIGQHTTRYVRVYINHKILMAYIFVMKWCDGKSNYE